MTNFACFWFADAKAKLEIHTFFEILYGHSADRYFLILILKTLTMKSLSSVHNFTFDLYLKYDCKELNVPLILCSHV